MVYFLYRERIFITHHYSYFFAVYSGTLFQSGHDPFGTHHDHWHQFLFSVHMAFAFIEFTDYYLDTWIVTTERIISIEQKGLFERTASELDLISVQDATAEVHGFL